MYQLTDMGMKDSDSAYHFGLFLAKKAAASLGKVSSSLWSALRLVREGRGGLHILLIPASHKVTEAATSKEWDTVPGK